MPENLNDTAATVDQNDEYMRDRSHPRGKPYSHKQQDSMALAKGKTMLYNKDTPTDGVVFEGHEVADARADGWLPEPLIHPNCPDKQPSSKDRDELMAYAKSIGLNPHHKLSMESLVKLIEGAKDG